MEKCHKHRILIAREENVIKFTDVPVSIKMTTTHFTGYLLGKVQLDGAIRSEVLASLVETLLQHYQSAEPNKKNARFNDAIKYAVECSERGLKLTSPGVKSKDEGFESDCDSLRSIKMTESGELNTLTELMDHLEISKEEKEPQSLSSGTSMDNTSISSSTNLQASDDNNSSSGNGSDSDEFCPFGERSPHWETLPNLSSFQSYPIEDVLFCHCDSPHPSILVWVVRHLAKMMALVTAFRTRTEAEELFQQYRGLRMKVKPVKHQKMNAVPGISNSPSKAACPPSPLVSVTAIGTGFQNPLPQPPASTSSLIPGHSQSFSSLPVAYLTEILHESQSKNPLFSRPPKFIDYDFPPPSTVSTLEKPESSKYASTRIGNSAFSERQPLQFMTWGTPKDTALVLGKKEEGLDKIEVLDESQPEGDIPRVLPVKKIPPPRPVRKLTPSSTGKVNRPVLLVPLKTESVSTPKSNYPKESYLYHVMGRTSSTFAPYQRSLNYLPQYAFTANKGNPGTEYLAWANGNGKQLLVPFSSWMELAEMNKTNGSSGSSGSSSQNHLVQMISKSRHTGRSGTGRTSALANLTGKGTARILLRDSAGHHHGMWATLSQRFKRNFRDNVMPKLNGIWVQGGEGAGRPKKKTTKKVTFNAWATVQVV